jgi:hypothetical protein
VQIAGSPPSGVPHVPITMARVRAESAVAFRTSNTPSSAKIATRTSTSRELKA